jgi:hypothetical protein
MSCSAPEHELDSLLDLECSSRSRLTEGIPTRTPRRSLAFLRLFSNWVSAGPGTDVESS